MLATLAQAVVNGLLIGGIYALVSIGVTLIFGVVKIVNFAQGEFVMIGMYISFFLANQYGIDPLLSLFVTMPVLFLAGVLIQHFLIRRLGLRNPRQRADQVLFNARQIDCFLGDFAEGDDRVLVIIAIDGQLLTAADVTGTLGGEQHEFEAVGDLLNAIFNGYARHAPGSPQSVEGKLTI